MYVSRKTISNWENDRGTPDLQSLMTLSELYQVPLSYFSDEINDLSVKSPTKHLDKIITKFSYFLNLLLIVLLIANFFLLETEHLFWVTPIAILNFCVFITFYQGWYNFTNKIILKKILTISIILFILSSLLSFGIQAGYEIKNNPAIILGVFIHSLTITVSIDLLLFGYKN